MKKELLILLMLVSTAMVMSAEGKQDDVEDLNYGRRPQGGMMRNYEGNNFSPEEFQEQRQEAMTEYIEGLEVVSVSGSLSLINGEMPFIENNGTKTYLMAPWQNVKDLGLENGMAISVEGYEMPGRPMQWDDSEKSVMVTKAIINGEEIEIDHFSDQNGMMGGFDGFGGFGGRGGNGKGGSGRNGGFHGGGMMGRRA